MGIFYTAQQPAMPMIRAALEDALKTDPRSLQQPLSHEAAGRALDVSQRVAPQFNALRFGIATLIAAVLLATAIWTKQQGLDDISKSLMTSFSGFSGIVLGLLGGESQKSST